MFGCSLYTIKTVRLSQVGTGGMPKNVMLSHDNVSKLISESVSGVSIIHADFIFGPIFGIYYHCVVMAHTANSSQMGHNA